ncbi:MAG: FGGY-family carbohydrate kinase [Cyclobacteriaceae bacterium]
MSTPSIAVFDIGKTNKKLYVFDLEGNKLYEEYTSFEEIKDEDGFPTEDLNALCEWMKKSFDDLLDDIRFDVQKLNFATYGASFVHLDKDGQFIESFYNYLKYLPEDFNKQFEADHGDKNTVVIDTYSPWLGLLNSGMQLRWLKEYQSEKYNRIHTSLHLPQYLSYLFTGKLFTDPTSLGCHTALWDFKKKTYHRWVKEDGIDSKFPELVQGDHSVKTTIKGKEIEVGVGIHDSSSALVPYLKKSKEPFILISTGTWSICLNSFSDDVLTEDQLAKDCLCFLNPYTVPVKASRLFLGNEYEVQTNKLAKHFDVPVDTHKTVKPNNDLLDKLIAGKLKNNFYPESINNPLLLKKYIKNFYDLNKYKTYDEAYHHMMWGLTLLQLDSLDLVLEKEKIKTIFIDGGFIHNTIFVSILEKMLPEIKIVPSEMPSGTALGAAMVIA